MLAVGCGGHPTDGDDPPPDPKGWTISVQIGKTAASLLGDSAAIALPDLPGLGAPMAVAPDAGGRYLHVKLQ